MLRFATDFRSGAAAQWPHEMVVEVHVELYVDRHALRMAIVLQPPPSQTVSGGEEDFVHIESPISLAFDTA